VYLNKKKIFLGTAQFLSDYGATNLNKSKSKKYFFNLLEYAGENGIFNYDTASTYRSEKLIGDFLNAHKISNAKICTKFHKLGDDYKSKIREILEKSISNLKSDIYCLFFHNVNDIKYFRKDPVFFLDLIKEYSIKKIGFSVYDPVEIKNINFNKKICIQIPYNLINLKFEKLIKLNKYNIFVRSIFFQGILLNKNIKKNFYINFKRDIKKALKKYHNYLAINKIDPLQFNLSFLNKKKNVDYFIFGYENKIQLETILSTKLKNFDQKKYLEVNRIFKKVNIDPVEWLKY